MASKKSSKKKQIISYEEKHTAATASVKNNTWLYAMILVTVSFLVNLNTFGHGFTVDDPLVINENKIVNKGVSGLGEIWTSSYLEGYNGVVDAAYRPVSLSLYAIGKSVHNLDETTMHISHVFLYSLGILLCFLFTKRLFKDHVMLAALAVLLYAVHPIHTEVVNNLKSRDEIMLMLGTMGMCYFYLIYLDRGKISLLFSALGMYALALFSKETAVAYFLLIPPLFAFYHKKWDQKSLLHALYFLSISIFYLAVRTAVVGTYDIDMTYMNNALVGEGNFFQRFPDAVMLMGKYLLMLVAPYPLSVDYSFNSIPLQGWSGIWTYVSLVAYCVLGYFAFRGLKAKSILGLLISWFFVTIAVASNVFVLIGSTFAERFLFVPSWAFCVALAYLIFNYFGDKAKYVLIVISLIFSCWTVIRNTHWKSDEVLFSRDVKFQESNARVQTFNGKFQYDAAKEIDGADKAEKLEIADRSLDKALEIAPDYLVANYYKGFVKKAQNNKEEAAKYFGNTVELDSTFKAARLQYAISLSQNNDYAKAVEQYRWLEKHGEQSFTVINNLSYSLFKNQQYAPAEEYMLRAYDMNPQSRLVLSNLVKLYRDGFKNMNKAIEYNDKLKAIPK